MSYCRDCGSPVPSGQKICSICYGDINYGSDGYYRDYIESWMRHNGEDIQRTPEDYGDTTIVPLDEESL